MQILRVAGEIKPRLIVMCKHSGGERGKMLRRTAMQVLHDAQCPVVLVPPQRGATPWHLHHVLVPHDGTPSTSGALRPAAELAEHGRAELLVVHVTDVRAAPAELGSLTTPRYVDQPQHEWPAWASEFIDRLACGCPLGQLHVGYSSPMAMRPRKSYACPRSNPRVRRCHFRPRWRANRYGACPRGGLEDGL